MCVPPHWTHNPTVSHTACPPLLHTPLLYSNLFSHLPYSLCSALPISRVENNRFFSSLLFTVLHYELPWKWQEKTRRRCRDKLLADPAMAAALPDSTLFVTGFCTLWVIFCWSCPCQWKRVHTCDISERWAGLSPAGNVGSSSPPRASPNITARDCMERWGGGVVDVTNLFLYLFSS